MTQPAPMILAAYHRLNEGLPITDPGAIQETHSQFNNAGVLATRTFTTAAGHRAGPLLPGIWEVVVANATSGLSIGNTIFYIIGGSTVVTDAGSMVFPHHWGVTGGTLVAGGGVLGPMVLSHHFVIPPRDPNMTYFYLQAGGAAGLTYRASFRLLRGVHP